MDTRIAPSRVLRLRVFLIGLMAGGALFACNPDIEGGPPVDTSPDAGVGQSATPVATSIQLSPPTFNLSISGTTALAASVRDQNGLAMSNMAVTWLTSNPAVVRIDTTGPLTATATALTAGTVTITASSAGKQATASGTVGNAGGGGDDEDELCDGGTVYYLPGCDQLYYNCDNGGQWYETNVGACSADNPENCTCGHWLGMIGQSGTCQQSGGTFTCDCDFCTPD